MRRIVLLYILSVASFQLVRSQVTSHIEFQRQPEKELQVIQVSWSDADKKNWDLTNDDRLEIMGVKTNILSTSLPLTKDRIPTFQFSINQQCDIELLLNIDEISPSEKIFLKDYATDEIIFEVPHLNHHQFLTPAFDPRSTYLVWSGDNNQRHESKFSIDNIYVHKPEEGRDRGIGFGTSLSCFPNAACKQDSILQLISNTTVRIRMVMNEGIGWCSGSFVNTTRNDRSPLILSAYHCTFQYTPKYDLWRFDLQYKSDSCANPVAEPQYFSLTGCQLKASGQGSDFLLVRLNNDVPLNQEVTFAGWNRDSIALPDTLYLVHHPNADIRKFSTCTTGAVINQNQIGWSEGYTTPGKHHFSFKFTEGGHQPGSSGGPVFNQDGYLIGQLHGGAMGCEDANHAFSGRLAKSWNYGTTAATRLKDWLDPDQIGVTQWPSLENIVKNDLVDIHGQVSDPLGRPVKNVEVVITGSTSQTIMTDDLGQFSLSGINRKGHYIITPKKDINQTNGLNVLDLIAIQKHLLSKDTFDFPWQYIAADATNNNHVSVGDIVLLLRLLLGKISYLPSSPSWRFDPPVIELDNLPQGLPAQPQFTGIKIGDLNNTANPAQ
ncbi:MAG: carboxypeptidase regulatory-like domain-containing protein [Saprospiraceae bacterium]|uniref:Carboxypeptidase regulatory-like domain-containing protein n=1 Tax=Candidatus Opimibacter skivensis TaxID=2982028 RepID=A0A9D7SSU5_9BACT|nr:carboxypeptidase regulatory-like domain-containing protein [Candidatus Opimibacter skivensis]